jgi:hypothetical protein
VGPSVDGAGGAAGAAAVLCARPGDGAVTPTDVTSL